MNDYNRDSSVSNIISKLEWPSLQIRRKNNSLAQLFKIVNNNLSAISPNDYLTPSKSLQGEITTLSSSNTPPSLAVLNTHSSLELSLNGIP